MVNRWIGRVMFALVVAPATLPAQFTTFIPPKDRARDSVKAVVAAEQKAVQDSVARAQIADMKTWVDSAAGLAVSTRPVDTLDLPPVATTPAAFVDGARAPATASPLPLMLVIGALALVLGATLTRSRERVPVRIRRE